MMTRAISIGDRAPEMKVAGIISALDVLRVFGGPRARREAESRRKTRAKRGKARPRRRPTRKKAPRA
jgi:hypothetical protein